MNVTAAPSAPPVAVGEPLGDHLSAISAVTTTGRLYLSVQERPFRAPDVVRFLKHLLSHVPGKLLVIWDGAPIHRARVVQDFAAAGAAARLRLEWLLAYAPDLNPDEGVWRHRKRVELRNRCCRDLPHLHQELTRGAKRLRHRTHVLHACIRHAGYTL